MHSSAPALPWYLPDGQSWQIEDASPGGANFPAGHNRQPSTPTVPLSSANFPSVQGVQASEISVCPGSQLEATALVNSKAVTPLKFIEQGYYNYDSIQYS